MSQYFLVGCVGGSGFGVREPRPPRFAGAPLLWLGKVVPALPIVALFVKWSRLCQSAGSSCT